MDGGGGDGGKTPSAARRGSIAGLVATAQGDGNGFAKSLGQVGGGQPGQEFLGGLAGGDETRAQGEGLAQQIGQMVGERSVVEAG